MTDSAYFLGPEQREAVEDEGYDILNADDYSEAQFRCAETLAERFHLPSYAQWDSNLQCRYERMPPWWSNPTERRKKFIAQVSDDIAWLLKQAEVNAGNARLNRVITGAAE